MKSMKVLLLAVILLPVGAWANMPKVDREDFSQLIVDGMRSSKALSQEIRKDLGVAPDRQENKRIQHAINNKKIKVQLGEVAEVSSPTTKFVRNRPVVVDLDESNNRRVAEEFSEAGY